MPALFVERDDFAVDNKSFRAQFLQRVDNRRKVRVAGIAVTRITPRFARLLHRDRAIAVELQFVLPVVALRNSLNRFAFHRRHEPQRRRHFLHVCLPVYSRGEGRPIVTDSLPATDSRLSCSILFSPPDWSRWFLFFHTPPTPKRSMRNRYISSCPIIAAAVRRSRINNNSRAFRSTAKRKARPLSRLSLFG